MNLTQKNTKFFIKFHSVANNTIGMILIFHIFFYSQILAKSSCGWSHSCSITQFFLYKKTKNYHYLVSTPKKRKKKKKKVAWWRHNRVPISFWESSHKLWAFLCTLGHKEWMIICTVFSRKWCGWETLKPPTTYPQQLAKLVDTKLGLNWWNPSTKPTSNQETTPKSANAQTGPAKERESSSLSLVLEGVVALQVRF